jgi:hypothetical protein
MLSTNVQVVNQVASRDVNTIQVQPKTGPVYATPRLVVLGQARDLVQGGNFGRYSDFRRGVYPGS